MNDVLSRWNGLKTLEATEEILPCCGSRAWAQAMAARRPIASEAGLLAASDEVWRRLLPADWLEAFRSHPRIGESHGSATVSARSTKWSREEQRSVGEGNDHIKTALAEGNRLYEERFHRIFIVCVTGKSAEEILESLRRRLANDEMTELYEAAEQQRQIAALRLKKWLHP